MGAGGDGYRHSLCVFVCMHEEDLEAAAASFDTLPPLQLTLPDVPACRTWRRSGGGSCGWSERWRR